MHRLRNIAPMIVLVAGVMCFPSRDTSAQQPWQITTTPHFDCYFEPQPQERINRVLFEAERAYARISLDLRYDLAERVPLVLVAADVATDPAVSMRLIQRMPPGHYLLVPAETDDLIEGIMLHELTHEFES